ERGLDPRRLRAIEREEAAHEPAPTPGGAVLGHPEVLPDGEAAEEADALERPADARGQDAVGRPPRDIPIAEPHASACRREDARNHVDNRALPGAVRADESQDLVL